MNSPAGSGLADLHAHQRRVHISLGIKPVLLRVAAHESAALGEVAGFRVLVRSPADSPPVFFCVDFFRVLFDFVVIAFDSFSIPSMA